jgi:sugar O-acyltransferase (sialic acid O-acetyltransferase NeuD family)
MKKSQIAIYGAGGFGREMAWLAQSAVIGGEGIEVVCFIDDDEAVCGATLNDIEVLSLSQTKEKYPATCVVSGIGVPKIRELTMEKARTSGFGFATLIHPRVEMSKWIEMGEGAVICAGNILTTNITLGRHVQINLDCTIGHDVIIGDYATLAPGVHVSGCVHIGKRAYIGTGAVIINGTQDHPIVIGDDVVVGAGACVTKSIPHGQTWGGYTCQDFEIADEFNRFKNWQYPEIEEGKPTKYNWVVQNKDNFRLGFKTDIGAFTYINAKYGVTIEDFVQIGSHCSIYSVSTIDDKNGRVVLKKNCRIGSHSVVMPGVTIGENSIVGAFSFVDKDIPGNVIAVGIPAKVIKKIESADYPD